MHNKSLIWTHKICMTHVKNRLREDQPVSGKEHQETAWWSLVLIGRWRGEWWSASWATYRSWTQLDRYVKQGNWCFNLLIAWIKQESEALMWEIWILLRDERSPDALLRLACYSLLVTSGDLSYSFWPLTPDVNKAQGWTLTLFFGTTLWKSLEISRLGNNQSSSSGSPCKKSLQSPSFFIPMLALKIKSTFNALRCCHWVVWIAVWVINQSNGWA